VKNIFLPMDVGGIKQYQQNRYPLLFVDQIIDLIPGESATGIKNFSYNEWFFPAHFDDDPNVPGFIQIEALVQVFIMTFLSIDEFKGEKTNFVKADNVVFKRKIIPGEKLVVEAKLDSFRRGVAIGSAVGRVSDEEACGASFVIAVPSYLEKFKPRQ